MVRARVYNPPRQNGGVDIAKSFCPSIFRGTAPTQKCVHYVYRERKVKAVFDQQYGSVMAAAFSCVPTIFFFFSLQREREKTIKSTPLLGVASYFFFYIFF